MNWDKPEGSTRKKAMLSFEGFDAGERMLLEILQKFSGQLPIDELSWKSNLPVSQLASLLLGLEFRGVISSLPGKIYKLNDV
jgi:DNA processing protein